MWDSRMYLKLSTNIKLSSISKKSAPFVTLIQDLEETLPQIATLKNPKPTSNEVPWIVSLQNPKKLTRFRITKESQPARKRISESTVMQPGLDDAGHNLATQDPVQELGVTDAGPRMTFTLFPINEQLPPEYRLVKLREVHDHRKALRRAMPGWKIANLADGSVDGMSYGGHTRLDRRDGVGHKLATQNPSSTYAKKE